MILFVNNHNIIGKDRFDYYIALSPQGEGQLFPRNAWQNIRKPMLIITGTRDDTLDGLPYTKRLEGFSYMKEGTQKWCAVIDGASHKNLGGKGLPRYRKTVCLLISRFIETLETSNQSGGINTNITIPGVISLQIK